MKKTKLLPVGAFALHNLPSWDKLETSYSIPAGSLPEVLMLPKK
jgi:hypothetical protein